MITKEEIKHLADMAMLKFSDEELKSFNEELNKVVKFVDKINELDTESIEPTYQINHTQILKDHDVSQVLNRDEVLQNTVEHQYGYFKILKVID